MKGPVKHVELLDYIRGIAIIAVLLFHSLNTVYGYDALPWKGWFRDFSAPPISYLCFLPFSIGDAGVAIFFVVSGFCIHLSFQQQGQRWSGFFIRRFFRIYPAYFAALIFFVSVGFFNMRIFGMNWTDIFNWKAGVQPFTHLILIHNIHPYTLGGINGSFWSLAIEAQLYLLYPALLVLVAKFEWRLTMVLLAGIELLIRGFDGSLVLSGTATSTVWDYVSYLLANSPLDYWFSWALGAFVADAFLKNQPLPFTKAPTILWFSLAIISYFIKPLFPFRFLLSAVTTAVITSKLLSGSPSPIKATSLPLNSLKHIGLWSYSIYLLHQPLLQIYCNVFAGVAPKEYCLDPIIFLFLVAMWLVIVPLRILWYKVIEIPGIALGKHIIRQLDIRHGTTIVPESLHMNETALLSHQTINNHKCITIKGRYFSMAAALLTIIAGTFFICANYVTPAPEIKNNKAWSLATNPDATKRNGALAVKLAEEACQRTHYQTTIMVGTLAAAYAEAGRFDDAIAAAQRACDLATQHGEKDLLQKNQELLKMFRSHRAYHEPFNTVQPQ